MHLSGDTLRNTPGHREGLKIPANVTTELGTAATHMWRYTSKESSENAPPPPRKEDTLTCRPTVAVGSTSCKCLFRSREYPPNRAQPYESKNHTQTHTK